MPVWMLEPIDERPHVTLQSWGCFEVPLRGMDQPWTRHLAGWSIEDQQGQVCSPLEAFSPETGQFQTQSGRIYQVVGSPGLNLDAQYVWEKWKCIWHVQQERDVSNEVLEVLRKAGSDAQWDRDGEKF